MVDQRRPQLLATHAPQPSADPPDTVFVALGDATRRDILARLRAGPQRVTGIAAAYPVSLNAVSKHLKLLERAGLIRREVRGREHWCSLDATPLAGVQRYAAAYASFWNDRLDHLQSLLGARQALRRAAQPRTPTSTPIEDSEP